MKRIVAIVFVLIFSVLSLSGCSPYSSSHWRDHTNKWNQNFEIATPNLLGAGSIPIDANADGWYCTMQENFDGDTLGPLWTPSPHGLRKTEYWCDQMVSLEDGCAIIKAEYYEDHSCDVCPNKGYFTSGIETRKMINGESINLFEQAFGYFETRVLFPKSGGMWSAFWLQTNSIGQLGNRGEDGSEIDIYESSFFNTNPMKMGHAIIYDGYGKEYHVGDRISKLETNLYEGYHTFALKWTPTEYVFFIDGVADWATNYGGVCKVPAFVRLTNEIRPGMIGPYGQKLKNFDPGEFKIDYVKIYQNINYLGYIKAPSDFS